MDVDVVGEVLIVVDGRKGAVGDLLGRSLPMAPVVANFNSHFWSCCLAILESKTKTLKALERLSWMTFQPVFWPILTLLPLPLIVQCCGTPQNADNDI